MTNQIGQTIAEQIGNRAFVMMGAKDLVAGANYLQFRVGKNSKRVSRVIVTLSPDDTYQVEAWRGSALRGSLAGTRSGVYVDQLNTALESLTGLYTRL
jgi:hypothetical protein